MRITSAEFAHCAVNPKDYPKDKLPEIALIGKSNVGKSSLINKLINRKGLAKTSSVPGKTRTVNFYRLKTTGAAGERAFYLVDLPGYGFAKAAKSEKVSWKQTIERYFNGRAELKGALVILDPRRDPGAPETELYRWLDSIGLRARTVLTKCDKLSNNKLASRKAAIKKVLGTNDFITFSADNGSGKMELSEAIDALLND